MMIQCQSYLPKLLISLKIFLKLNTKPKVQSANKRIRFMKLVGSRGNFLSLTQGQIFRAYKGTLLPKYILGSATQSNK